MPLISFLKQSLQTRRKSIPTLPSRLVGLGGDESFKHGSFCYDTVGQRRSIRGAYETRVSRTILHLLSVHLSVKLICMVVSISFRLGHKGQVNRVPGSNMPALPPSLLALELASITPTTSRLGHCKPEEGDKTHENQTSLPLWEGRCDRMRYPGKLRAVQMRHHPKDTRLQKEATGVIFCPHKNSSYGSHCSVSLPPLPLCR
ncbi:hypothetical protein GE09DRAFT_328350 [Coniochaeta sp. 2T2.1]|nr:hypothetical protein GE09DRAFT_328350 [Coniochaeta sp. 2T2.1]